MKRVRKSTDGGKIFSCIKITNDLTPQLWDGSTWLTPGYGHLSLKALLCWEGLNHTKNDQPGNYETRLGALWAMSIITLRESDWYRTQWICSTNL